MNAMHLIIAVAIGIIIYWVALILYFWRKERRK